MHVDSVVRAIMVRWVAHQDVGYVTNDAFFAWIVLAYFYECPNALLLRAQHSRGERTTSSGERTTLPE